MAFTKVVGAGIHTLSNIASHNINSSGIITATKFVGPIEGNITAVDGVFTGNVSIAKTLTYEDVKNVDSVGIGTFREGIFLPDDKRIKLGNTAASPDLQIYHQSSDQTSIIQHTGNSTPLFLKSTNEVRIEPVGLFQVRNQSSHEKYILATNDGSVDLYFNGNKKFETTSSGVSIGGTTIITSASGGKLGIGTDNPLQKLHVYGSGNQLIMLQSTTSANAQLQLKTSQRTYNIENVTGGTLQIRDGSVGQTRLSINSSGNATFGGNLIIPDKIIHSGDTNTFIRFLDAGDIISMTVGNYEKVKIELSDITIPNANLSLQSDNHRLKLGAGNDFQLSHTGTVNRIQSYVGNIEYISPAGSSHSFQINSQEKVRIDSSGRVLIGTTASRTTNSHTPALQISGDNYSEATVQIINNDNASHGAYLFMGKQRSGSPGGNTIAANGDIVGQIRFSYADGTDMENQCAQIQATVDGVPGSNDTPGRLSFYTTPDNSTVLTERLRITSGGSVNIGGDYSQTSQKLKVTGNTTIDGTLTAGIGFVCAGGYSIFSGNVTQQGYTFHDADSDTYFGFPSNDQFAIFTAGTQRLKIFSNGNSDFDVAGGTLKVTGTGAYGLSIHNTNSPSMGHLFIYGDNGLIRFRNSSNTYTAQIGYAESNNSLFFNNQEAGTTLSIIDDGVQINDNEKFLCGNDKDLQIYHDSTANFNNIQSLAGSNLRIRQQQNGAGLYLSATHIYLQNHDNNETYLHAQNNGSVSLYHNNLIRAYTAADGFALSRVNTFPNPNNTGSEITGAMLDIGGNLHLEERYPAGAYSDRQDLVFRFNTGYGQGFTDKFRFTSGGGLIKYTTGQVLFGLDTSRTINSHAPQLQITGLGYSNSTMSIINNENNVNGSYIFLGKQRSGAVGGSTAVQANDIIGELRFPAGDGTDMENYAAQIMVRADQNASNNNTSGYIDFYTTRQNGSSEHKMRMTQNSNHSHLFSMGTSTTHLNNCSTPDRTSVKIGGLLHLEGPFGHNATPGMYYNCYSGGNDLFYRGTGAPSGGDRRPAAYGQKFGGHYFYGDTSSTAWTAQQQITTMQTNMQITSQGYVLKPAHPSFHARLINHKNADQDPLVFDDVLVNVGSHYKSTGSDAGKFVVPIAGTYFFFWEAIKNSNSGSVSRLYLMKNGSRTYNSMHLRLQEEGAYANGCMNVIMTLAAGDKIHIDLEDGGVHASEYTHFGGYLIG